MTPKPTETVEVNFRMLPDTVFEQFI